MPPSNNSNDSYLNTSTIIAVVSTAALIYTQWSNLPDWVFKEGGDGQTARSSDKDANDDLATPAAVMDKLVEMMDIVGKVSDKVVPTHSKKKKKQNNNNNNNTRSMDTEHDEEKTKALTDSMTEVQMIAACYSLIHLHRELRAKDPDYRDKLYNDDRKDDDVHLDELNELAEYLEYAHWAYESSHSVIAQNCKAAGLDLIRHDTATEPGRVGHFVAANHSEKLVIIGLKGTSTISDVLTDLIAIPKEHVGCYFDDDTFAAPPKNTSKSDKATETMRCHEGIFTAAIWVADSLQPMIENFFVPLNYKVIICGHSLGEFMTLNREMFLWTGYFMYFEEAVLSYWRRYPFCI